MKGRANAPLPFIYIHTFDLEELEPYHKSSDALNKRAIHSIVTKHHQLHKDPSQAKDSIFESFPVLIWIWGIQQLNNNLYGRIHELNVYIWFWRRGNTANSLSDWKDMDPFEILDSWIDNNLQVASIAFDVVVFSVSRLNFMSLWLKIRKEQRINFESILVFNVFDLIQVKSRRQ